MERTKKTESFGEPELRWRKTGGGSLRLQNPYRIIKPGQTFSAKTSDIPTAFRDLVICLNTEEEVVAAKEATAQAIMDADIQFEIVEIPEKKAWYNVVKAGEIKAINEKPMRKKDAEELVATLKG